MAVAIINSHVVSVIINDKHDVTITYRDGRVVKYLYNRIVSEINGYGVQTSIMEIS